MNDHTGTCYQEKDQLYLALFKVHKVLGEEGRFIEDGLRSLASGLWYLKCHISMGKHFRKLRCWLDKFDQEKEGPVN